MDSIEIGKLKANPFKKEINKGKMNEVQIKEISGNLKELGYMGAIPVVKIKGNYHLVNSHHRIEALKRKFGKKYKVAITIHDYNNDQLLRGMVIENLAQRGSDFGEEKENIKAVENYLNKNKEKLRSVRAARIEQKEDRLGRNNLAKVEGKYPNADAKDIQQWLQLSKEKWGDDQINSIMNIYTKLDPELLEKVDYQRNQEKKSEESISVMDAHNISRIDLKEQKKMKKILDETKLDYKSKAKLISAYKEADETTKRLIRENKLDIISIAPTLKNHKGELIKFKPKNIDEEIAELNDVSLVYTKKLKEFSANHLVKCNKSKRNFLKFHIAGTLQQLKKFYDKIQKEDFN